MSTALARDKHSIRSRVKKKQGELYGKKTAKSTKDPAPSDVPMDPGQDGQDRLSPLAQRRSVGVPGARHDQHRVEPGAEGAAPALCKRSGVYEAGDPGPGNPPVLCADGEAAEKEQATSRRYGILGLLSRQ